MTDQSTDADALIPPALAEPRARPEPGWIAGLGLASLGMWMASLTPIQVLLPMQLQNIDNAHKILALAICLGLGAVASVLATPMAGALSDRTTHAYSFSACTGAGTAGRWSWPCSARSACC